MYLPYTWQKFCCHLYSFGDFFVINCNFCLVISVIAALQKWPRQKINEGPVNYWNFEVVKQINNGNWRIKFMSLTKVVYYDTLYISYTEVCLW